MANEDFEIKNVDPLADIRSAISMMVGARLSLQKALQSVKDNGLEYEIAINELEEAIDGSYENEKRAGDAHQAIIIALATEGCTL